MVRLSRAELQKRNRVRVLAAARDEFTERGFRDAKVDQIAERAELTRGAVYSNFPSKRALYFAVLAQAAEQAPGPRHPPAARPAARSWGTSRGLGSPRFPWPTKSGTAWPGRAGTYCPRSRPTSGPAGRSPS